MVEVRPFCASTDFMNSPDGLDGSVGATHCSRDRKVFFLPRAIPMRHGEGLISTVFLCSGILF